MTEFTITDEDVLTYLSMDLKTWNYINKKCGHLKSYLIDDIMKKKSSDKNTAGGHSIDGKKPGESFADRINIV